MNVFDYIKQEENTWKTEKVPLTNSKEWNMKDHIERCMNVANGWFHNGENDGLRPYNDIVTPIIDVAFRLEGFDVKDIVPFVDDIEENYKSFLIKKYHPQWARKNELDTFIDEVVESSVIYDLVLIKNLNQSRPEVVKLQDIAFCDQTDILSGALCIKHQYSIPQLLDYKGKWDDDKIDEAIIMAQAEKTISTATDRKVKTPSKYMEVYELRGSFPETWLDKEGDENVYTPQLHIVTYYTAKDGSKNGIKLFDGKDKKLSDNFKALKIDQVRSHGRACGKSIVERLFEPQVWNNYSGIKIKKMLDSAVNLLQTDSEEYGNMKISDLKEMRVLKHEPGRPISRVDMNLQNVTELTNYQTQQENNARMLGSASDGALGRNPVSGTPFALQDLVVQQGEGIHDYRRGKIATFFADVLYRDWILSYLVKDMNNGVKFSEDLSLDEMEEVMTEITKNLVNTRLKEGMLEGRTYTAEDKEALSQVVIADLMKGSKKQFMEVLKGELKDIPVKVFVNVAGKQRNMAQNADKISKLVGNILANPEAFATIPGLAKSYNELLEESGMSAIDFSQVTRGVQQTPQAPTAKIKSPISTEELKTNTQ